MADAKARLRIEGENAVGAAFAAAVKDAQGTANKMQGIFRAAFASISVAGTAATFKALIAHSIEVGDELSKAAVKAGLGGKAISELAFAAKMADVDLGSLSDSLRFMQVNLSKAATGGAEQKQTLAALGLTFENLKRLAPDQQFERIAEQISKLRDPADRARAATELFGKSGANLLPLFEQGAEGIRKAREEAQQFGLSLSDEQLKKLTEADAAVKRMNASFEGLALTLTAKVAPGLTAAFDKMREFVTSPMLEKLATLSKLGALANPVTAMAALPALFGNGDLTPVQTTVKRIGEGPPGFAAAAATPALPDLIRQINRQLREEFSTPSRLGSRWKPVAIDAQELIDIRYDQFGEQMHDALDQTARDTAEAMSEAFNRPLGEVASTFRDGMRAAFDDLVDHGHFSFRKLSQFIIAELSKKQIYRAIDNLSDYLDRAFSKSRGSGSGSGFGSFLGSLFGSFGGADSGISSSIGSGAALNQAVLGFANGGSFEVGGQAGTDANLVAFRASRGENVTITPPGRRASPVIHVTQYNSFLGAGDIELRASMPAFAKQISEATVARVRDLVARDRF